MDLPTVLVVLTIDVLVLGFTDGETDIVSLTDVPPGYPVARLDKLFLVQDPRGESMGGEESVRFGYDREAGRCNGEALRYNHQVAG